MSIAFGRRAFGFVRSTVIGGVFVLAPVVLLLVVIGKALSAAYEALQPAVAVLPVQSVGGVSLAVLLGTAGLVGACFLAGLLADTTLARWATRTVETVVLSNLPGYALMKSMGEGMVGLEGKGNRPAVLARIAESEQIGFVMDALPDGRNVVFVPGVPNPWAGSLHVLPPDQCRSLGVPVKVAVEMIQRMGVNSAAILGADRDSS